MSRRKNDEYNFVGLARSPPASRNATPAPAGGYYPSLSGNKRATDTRPSSVYSAAQTGRKPTGSSSSHHRRHALQPVTGNAGLDAVPQSPPATTSWKQTVPQVPESANRSTLLVSRALRLSPATENKMAKSMNSTTGYKPPSSQPRAPLFQTDQSPVPQRARTKSSKVTSGSRAVLSREPGETMLSPPRGSSKRSPVPAFTPGFQDESCVIEQPATPAMPDPYLSSAEYTDTVGDGSRWSDFSTSSLHGVFSPDPPTPMPATARRAQAKKMALLALRSSSLLSSSERAFPTDPVEEIDEGETPPRVARSGNLPDVMVASTPAAASALMSMASGMMSREMDLNEHSIDAISPVGDEVVMDGVRVPRDDEVDGEQDDDVCVYDMSNPSIDVQQVRRI